MNRTLRTVFLSIALAAPLCAQHYHPAPGYLAELQITDAKTLAAAMRDTAVGRLLQSPELAPVVLQFEKRYQERKQRIEKLKALARTAGVQDDDLESLTGEAGEMLQDQLSGGDLRELRLWFWMSQPKHEPTIVVSFSAADATGKRLHGLWQKAAKKLSDDKTLAPVGDAPELGGHKLELLRHQPADGEAVNVWFWSDGEQHVLGIGDQVLPGSFEKEPAPVAPGISRVLAGKPGIALSLSGDRLRALTGKQEGPPNADARLLGTDSVASLSLAVTVDGDHFRESLFVELPKETHGLLAAWTEAKAPLPAHPQVQDALMQVGMSVDLARFETVLRDQERGNVANGATSKRSRFAMLFPDLAKALTGGVSFQVSAPGKGSMVPRLSLAAGIADRAALDGLLARARKELEGIEFDDRETEGVKWTSVKIPNSPSALVPTFAVLDDVFVLAESPATLKAMIKAVQEKAPSAMPTEGAPAVAAVGETRPGLDVRYDVSAIWRVLQKHYLPIVQLFAGQGMMAGGIRGEPLLEQGELPEAAVIAPHLGLGRGGLAVVDGGVLLTTASSLGDPMTAAFYSIMVPMLPSILGMSLDAAAGQLQGRIGETRLKRVHQALATWRASFGGGKSLPRSLGELFSRGLLDGDDALLVPGASDPQKFEYEDADGAVKKVASSFRYVPDGKLKVSKQKLARLALPSGMPFVFTEWDEEKDHKDDEVVVVLYEHKEHPRGLRLLLTADGAVHQIPEKAAAEMLGGK